MSGEIKKIDSIKNMAVFQDFRWSSSVRNPQTAPSKRLAALGSNGPFLKTTTGISVAEKIGIEKMRNKCPLFNEWLSAFENIQRKGRQ